MEKDLDISFVDMPVSGVMEFEAKNDMTGYGGDSGTIFDADDIVPTLTVEVNGKSYEYIPFGADNRLCFDMIRFIGGSSVLSENKLFNVLTCYGKGVQYMDIDTDSPTKDKAIKLFLLHNSIARFTLEQITDLKFFYYSVCAVILNKAGNKIVSIRHKEACYCRFEKSKNGRSEHVFFANWRNGVNPEQVEVLPILDELDPLGDLQYRMGLNSSDGSTKLRGGPKTNDRVFAIVTRFPTPGQQYYPVPYYTALFRDGWFDISRLIAIGKKAKLKNHAAIPYLVEIHKDYWKGIFKEEHITQPEKQKERVLVEKERIKKFIGGIENSGKIWVAGFYTTPDGKEVQMVRITRIDTSKDGGDYSDDIAESNNMMCYADNVHPNLVGATPGKSQMNNSGSDKRELFTLKQSIETAFHDLLLTVHQVTVYFNKWEELVYPDIPMLMLTTLDENKDAKMVTANPASHDNN